MNRRVMMAIKDARLLLFFLALGCGGLGQQTARAGGSGLNVAVVVNQASSNSVALGNYYCERRQVPPENVIRINWTGGNLQWSSTDFTNTLLNPLLGALTARGISNQIDYVVLCMDIPYRVSEAGGVNSTTSVLYYGFKADTVPPGGLPATCSLPPNSANSYSSSEGIFRLAKPVTAPGYSFLTLLLTGETLAQAKALVDAGVNSDGTFPTNPVLLQKTSDGARNIRFYEFDNAVFSYRLRGAPAYSRVTNDVTQGQGNLLGYETGLANFSLANTAFVPGAMADSLTSFGGAIFEGGYGQTTLLEFIKAGAAGSYGTVVEPCNYLQKFPDPQNYFFQARGFTLGECYYQSLRNPYQGLLVGEPLAAPFRQVAQVNWVGLAPNTILSGTANLSLAALAPDMDHPVQQVDLFVDGKFYQTVTNIAPAAGNVLNVTIAGFTTNYTVPANATLKSVASGLTGVLYSLMLLVDPTGLSNVTPFGDRVQVEYGGPSTSIVSTAVSSTLGTADALTTFLSAAGTNFLLSVAEPTNPYDTPPRNHYYVTAGTANLALTFPLDTTTLADGFHELTAVVYEGTHVHTQTRATVPVLVQNTALSATLTLIGAGALTALEANFTAQATASVANIASIELFTTGGRFAVVTDQQTAAFSLAGTNLGLGQHPFYAVVTTTGGQKFRTPNTVIRIVGPESEIMAGIQLNSPPLITWSGVAGRRYNILSADLPDGPYLLRDAVIASNSTFNMWSDLAVPVDLNQRFYKVSLAP